MTSVAAEPGRRDRDTIGAARQNWLRVLLATLGTFELLMAAGATATAMVVGVTGAAALIAAAWLAGGDRRIVGSLLVLGTIPFAVVAWSALVPVLLLVVVAALAMPVMHATPAR